MLMHKFRKFIYFRVTLFIVKFSESQGYILAGTRWLRPRTLNYKICINMQNVQKVQ